jgi:hypothetical protein
MTEAALVADNDAPQPTEPEYLAAVAALRLQHLIACALHDYCTKQTERRDMLPSAWVANELVRQVPGILQAVQAGGRQ